MSIRQQEPDQEIEEDLEIETIPKDISKSISSVTPPLNPVDLNPGDKVTIVGTSRCGKSTLIRRLVHDNQHKFNLIWAFTGTTRVNQDYVWNAPFVVDVSVPTRIGEDTHVMTLKKIVRAQMEIAIMCNDKGQPAPSMLIILDDCLDIDFYRDASWWGSWMSKLRHYRLSVIFSIQTAHKALPTTIRSQNDKVYVYKNQSEPELVMGMVSGLDYQGKRYVGRAAGMILSKLIDQDYQCVFFRNVGTPVHGHVFTCEVPPKLMMNYGILGR